MPVEAVFRKIIHLDLDAFFCAVEELRDETLRGVPFAVGGQPQSRGVVASCSYPARRFGVRSAMPMGIAVKRCPDLRIVPADHREYSRISRKVMQRLHLVTSLVEQISIDEAFLDVSNRPASAVDLAVKLQATIRDELGLPNSLGVASNKLVAKIANNVGKATAGGDGPPNAIQVVPPGQEAEFLVPLPSTALWGVGPKTAERLHELGIETIGDIARWPEGELSRLFGKHGTDLSRRAKGIDDRPVITQRDPKSVSQERTFARDIDDADELRAVVQRLAEGVARRLKRRQMAGTTVKLKLRWSDFTTPTRQTTLAKPTDDADLIARTALKLFDALWRVGEPVRLLGVGVSGLDEQPYQPTLWDVGSEAFARAEAEYEKQARLKQVVDSLSERYGENALRRGDTEER